MSPLRALLTLTIATLALVGIAPPAGADPAKPGDYESVVTRFDPEVSGVHLRVVGGDSFLELRVDRGHEATVEGYSGEPWLRLRKDGTVEENVLSEAAYLNGDRYAQVTLPSNVDNTAPPSWKVIGHDGTYVWHDHRIHWMSPIRPPGKQAGDVVLEDWIVPMTVDGTAVAAHGTLVWKLAASPVPWVLVASVALVVLLIGARRDPVIVGALAVTSTSAAAMFVGLGQRAATPSAAGGTPLVYLVPAVGVFAGVLALLLRRKQVAVLLVLVAVAALSGWALLRLGVLTHPVLPTDLPADLDRAVTAAALAVSVGASYAVITSGLLRLPDEEVEPGGGLR